MIKRDQKKKRYYFDTNYTQPGNNIFISLNLNGYKFNNLFQHE